MAPDHAGFRLKTVVAEWLGESGHDVVDLGTDSEEPVGCPTTDFDSGRHQGRIEALRAIERDKSQTS